MSGDPGARLSFKVVSVEPSWLILQRIVLAAEDDFTTKCIQWGHDWISGPKVAATPVSFVKGQIVRATVLWSPIWRVGASISAKAVLQRCWPE